MQQWCPVTPHPTYMVLLLNDTGVSLLDCCCNSTKQQETSRLSGRVTDTDWNSVFSCESSKNNLSRFTLHSSLSSDGQIQIMIWFKSWLNHWWWFDLSTKDLIWKHVIWFGVDFILCDLIRWFEQITTLSNLGQGIMITLFVFLLQLS